MRRNLGRVGAAQGPDHLRQALGQFALVKDLGFDIHDFGNIVCADTNLESAQEALGQAVRMLSQHYYFPLVFGGGHETAWGHFQGIDPQNHENIGIINFDAHYDLRMPSADNKGTSGTPFYQIADYLKSQAKDFNYYCIGVRKHANTKSLFKTAKQLNVNTLLHDEIYQDANAIDKVIQTAITKHDALYITVCMDVFSYAYAPGVSAISPLGLTPYHVIPALKKLAKSNKVVNFDIVEYSPPLDRDHITARLAAYIVSEFISELTIS